MDTSRVGHAGGVENVAGGEFGKWSFGHLSHRAGGPGEGGRVVEEAGAGRAIGLHREELAQGEGNFLVVVEIVEKEAALGADGGAIF